MADTLRYLGEARALLPDNAQNLVSPQDVREYLLALEPDRGGYAIPPQTTPIVVSLTTDVWVELVSSTLDGLTSPLRNLVRWSNDAESRPLPDWGGDVTVPAGHMRQAYVTAILSCDPDANNDDVFEIAIVYGGVVDESSAEVFRITENNEIQTVTLIHARELAQDGSQAVSVAIRNTNASRDINVYSFAAIVQGHAYEQAPT